MPVASLTYPRSTSPSPRLSRSLAHTIDGSELDSTLFDPTQKRYALDLDLKASTSHRSTRSQHDERAYVPTSAWIDPPSSLELKASTMETFRSRSRSLSSATSGYLSTDRDDDSEYDSDDDEAREAQLQFEESLRQLQSLVNLVIVPWVSRYFGRKYSYYRLSFSLYTTSFTRVYDTDNCTSFREVFESRLGKTFLCRQHVGKLAHRKRVAVTYSCARGGRRRGAKVDKDVVKLSCSSFFWSSCDGNANCVANDDAGDL